jgi:hypothetical protein
MCGGRFWEGTSRKVPLGRPRRRWEDNIKVNVNGKKRALTVLVWFGMKTSDVFLKTVKEHLGCIKVGNSLASLTCLYIQGVTGGTDQTSGGCSLC